MSESDEWNCHICGKAYNQKDFNNQRCEWCGRSVCHDCVGNYQTVSRHNKFYDLYTVWCINCVVRFIKIPFIWPVQPRQATKKKKQGDDTQQQIEIDYRGK